MTTTISIILTFIIAIIIGGIAPLMNFRLYEINPDYFKKVKVKNFSRLFKGLGGKNSIYGDVKNYGIIYPMFIMHILGYIFSILSIIVAFLLLYAFNITPLVVIIVIGCIFVIDLIILFVTTAVCAIISKKKDKMSK